MLTFELISRRKKLKSLIQDKECLLFHPRDMMQKGDDEFFHSIDSTFQYFFSNQKIDMLVYVTLIDSKLEVFLGIEKKSDIEIKFMGNISFEEISKSTQINESNIMYLGELKNKIKDDLDNKRILKVNSVYEEDKNYFSKFKLLLKNLSNEFSIEIKNKIKEIQELRVIKENNEILAIQKANNISKEVFEYTLSKINLAKTEQEIFAHLSFKNFELNSTHAFYPIIASGKNATILHYNQHNDILNENELILLDFGSEYFGYKSDISRTVPKSGKFTSRQKEVYQSVLRIQDFAFSQIKEGMNLVEYEKNVFNKVGEELIYLNLLTKGQIDKDNQVIRKYYPHRCSHYLGLDTHDCGDYKTIMKEGMVLTVEPGIYIEEEGIGIRIEDNVVVKKEGVENLSKNIIKSTGEIENFF